MWSLKTVVQTPENNIFDLLSCSVQLKKNTITSLRKLFALTCFWLSVGTPFRSLSDAPVILCDMEVAISVQYVLLREHKKEKAIKSEKIHRL